MPRFGDGGGERAWLNLLARLDRTRFDPALAFLESVESHFTAEIPPDVRVYDLRKRHRLALELPRMVWRLARLLRRERPAVLLSMMHTWGFLLEAAKSVARVRVPVIANEHIHVGSSLAFLEGQRPLLSRAAPLLHRLAYRRAARVVAVAGVQAEELRTRFGVPAGRLVVIPNGVDRERIEALAAEPLDDPWLTERPLVAAAGRLIPQKGFEDLLDAFALVRARVEARLAIVGEGELREPLERRIAELGLAGDARLLGRLANPFAVLGRAQVFVLSSRWEALPQVIAEALALGVPVVSTDCPSGPAELLDGGRAGVLVPPEDPGALAGAIAALLEDAGWRAELAEAGRRRAGAYAVEEMVRRYEEELAAAAGRA
jgi:glycosyltransferase involved in cell wall biosynthesis